MLEYSFCLVHTLPAFVPRTIKTTAAAFWKNAEPSVYYGKSVALVLILSREALKQLASSVVTGDDPV